MNLRLSTRCIAALLYGLFPLLLAAQNQLTPPTVYDTAHKKDLIDIGKKILRIRPKKIPQTGEKRIYFSLLPITSSTPGGGRVLVTSTTAGFYLGDKRNTSLSTFTFSPYYNFKGRFGLPIRSNTWLRNNSWNLQGDTRLLVYPQYTWGLGGHTDEGTKKLVDYKYIRFYHNALKRIKPYFMAGLGYNLDYRIGIKTVNDSIGLQKFTGYDYGTASQKNTFSSGLTLHVLYDTRNNSINPLPGVYANLVYRTNPRFLGSDDNWQSLYLDLRKYLSFSDQRQQVLAFWSYYWTVLNNKAPYLDLPSVGWDLYNRSGRGFDQNRYRGKGLLYFESEYRSDITANGLFGFVLFANVNSVSEPGTHQFSYLNAAAGTGLRIKFNKKSNTNVALDIGFSKHYTGVYIDLGEAF